MRLSGMKQWMIVIIGIATLALAIWTSPAPLSARPAPTVDASCSASRLRPEDYALSPDGTYFATNDFVVETTTGFCQRRPLSVSGAFHGWTADGRYAVFNARDHYGNGYGILFEPSSSKSTIWGDGCASMNGACHFRVMALAPVMRRVLIEDGTLLFLRNAEQYSLLEDGNLIAAAAFSPGEQFLAYVQYRSTGQYDHGDHYALHVRSGDTNEPRHLMDLAVEWDEAITIEWAQDDTPKFTLRVGEHRWLVNVWTDEIFPDP